MNKNDIECYELTIKASCHNCVFAKSAEPRTGNTICSKTGKKIRIYCTTPLCKYWKPSVYDIDIWIQRWKKNKLAKKSRKANR